MDDCYFELKTTLEENIGMEPITKDQIETIIKKSVQDSIKNLQTKLSRFLDFDEILEETKKFK